MDEKLMCNNINEVCNELFLTQVVKSPTHKDGNKAEPSADYSPQPKPSSFHVLNFHHDEVQWDTLAEKLQNVEWSTNFKDRSPDEILSFIYNETYKAAN